MYLLLYILIPILTITLLIVVMWHGVMRRNNQEKQEEIKEKIQETIRIVNNTLPDRKTYLSEALLNTDHYFTYSECKKFEEETKDLYEQLDFLRCNGALQQFTEDVINFYEQRKNLETIRNNHNKEFIAKELEKQKEFFDSILDFPLDNQQRDSIVKLEDNCLVISSAGSGKTSTMIGKLLYLVHQRKIRPSRILTITYTHKASEELTQRLMGTGLSCMTFHKLAMTIVSKVEGQIPSIADNGLFVKVFYDQLGKPEFRNAILNYLSDYKSLVKDEHAYNNSIEYYKDRRKL